MKLPWLTALVVLACARPGNYVCVTRGCLDADTFERLCSSRARHLKTYGVPPHVTQLEEFSHPEFDACMYSGGFVSVVQRESPPRPAPTLAGQAIVDLPDGVRPELD